MKNGKLPATIDGLLERIQLTFLDLERQEKRALTAIRKREEEIEARKIEENDTSGRTLKEIEILDGLQNKTLDIINVNNKSKIDLVKYYGTMILSKQSVLEDKNSDVESEEGDSQVLSDKDLADIRKHLQFNKI